MNFSFDLHLGYALMVVLGFALTLTFPLTRHFQDPRDRRRYYAMQAITAVCALLGAKLAVVLGDALWPLEEFHGWGALLGGGRSIAGALLFGFLGVEAAKPLLRYDIPPNDRFAIVLPFSIGLGRIGCLIVGCCRGAAVRRSVGHHLCRRHTAPSRTALRNGVSLGDGIPADRAVAPAAPVRSPVRAVSRELRRVPVLHANTCAKRRRPMATCRRTRS